MEVRKGYKQTDVGVIPENWSTPKIESIIDEISMGPFGSDITVSNFVSSGVPVLNGANVAAERLKDSFENFVTFEKAKSLKKAVARRGDIVVTHRGTIGQISYIPDDSMFDRYVVSQSQFRVRFNKNFVIPAWVVLYFHSESGSKKLLEGKGHTGVPAIAAPTTTFRNLSIPLPSLAEQEAIAEALSDADALIESLETLLAKKRQVKQGAMSELLSGKKRLPEFDKKQGYKQTPFGVFPKDWEIVPLKEVSSMHGRIGWQGLKQTEFTMNSDEPFLITGMNFKDGEIRWEEVYHISEERYGIAKEIQLKIGDVLMTKDGTIGKILFVDHIPYPGKASLNSHLLVFRPINKRYVPKFMFYQLNYRTFHNHIELEKSGTTFFGITQEAVGKYNAFLPSIVEQTAIVEILSDMDAEIRAVEEKLSKARAVKAGMMSELLTGRVRLV